MTTVLAFIIVLSVLIFFHELGHFLFARLFGVGVEKFSLGFGPRLFGKTVGITDYRISAIPLGGYVKMVGEEPDAEIPPEDIPISFTHKHVFKRMLIVAAGPAFNFLLAILIFFAIFAISGTTDRNYSVEPLIGEVNKDAPAEKAGLKKGDMVLAIDGTTLKTWEEMAGLITKSKGTPLSVTVRRETSEFTLTITPELQKIKDEMLGEETERYVIGVTRSYQEVKKDMAVIEAAKESLVWTYKVSELMVVIVAKMIQGDIPTKTIGGPILIAQLAGERAADGADSLMFFIAVLSVNLAVLNFLPIPVLDGGHLLFFFIEAVMRRPLNTKMREVAQQMGIFVLILLMIFVFYNDISRVFFS